MGGAECKARHRSPAAFAVVPSALRKAQRSSKKLRLIAFARFPRAWADQRGELSAEELEAVEREIFSVGLTAWSQLSAERAHRTAEASELVIEAVRRAQHSMPSSIGIPKSSSPKRSGAGRKRARWRARPAGARKQ